VRGAKPRGTRQTTGTEQAVAIKAAAGASVTLALGVGQELVGGARHQASPGRHCLFYTVIDCHWLPLPPLNICTIILLPLLSFPAKMTVSPLATPGRAPSCWPGGAARGRHVHAPPEPVRGLSAALQRARAPAGLARPRHRCPHRSGPRPARCQRPSLRAAGRSHCAGLSHGTGSHSIWCGWPRSPDAHRPL
jgi:hypothetical protein